MSAQTQNDLDQEIDFTPGGEEDLAGQDPAMPEPQAKPKEPEEPEDVLDTLVPRKEPVSWVIGPEDMQRTFVQKPLSFIGKMQWFSLIGDALDRAMSGPSAMSINSLFESPMRNGQVRAEDFRNADTFVQAVGKLLAVAPDFLVKSYCIWLNVPDYDRTIVGEMMMLPPDEGGLSDDQGIEIIETFLDQNYEALATFFGEKVGKLQQRVQMLNKVRATRRSKR